ncbi:MAG: TatD family hydrolase [Verrucomicrobiota bacterium]|jgi:TatD DNase family protein|nr:TatD family hydrolase [Verrucomicrobiota bacterium]
MSISSPVCNATQKLHWIDTHSHLQNRRLAPYLTGVIERARNSGVELLHVNATCEADWPAVAVLADDYPDLVRCSFGIHPWFVYTRSKNWLEHLRGILADRCCGVGEIGLDGRMNDDLDEERAAVFRTQLDLSYELALPVSIHCRDAWQPLLDILLNQPPHPAGVLLHAYSGPPDVLAQLTAKNVYISFGGSLTRPKNQRGRENAAQVPEGHFVLESDAPDLPPALPEAIPPYLEDENEKAISEPAYIPYVALHLAKERGVSICDISEQSTANARRLFAKLLAPK